MLYKLLAFRYSLLAALGNNGAIEIKSEQRTANSEQRSSKPDIL